jgi:hypothetical protein
MCGRLFDYTYFATRMRVVCVFDFINHVNCVVAINDVALFTSVDAKAGYGMRVFCKSSLLGDFFDFVT